MRYSWALSEPSEKKRSLVPSERVQARIEERREGGDFYSPRTRRLKPLKIFIHRRECQCLCNTIYFFYKQLSFNFYCTKMARNLGGFLVLIAAALIYSSALASYIFQPISDSHRSAALELFNPLGGSFPRFSKTPLILSISYFAD